MPTLIVKTSIIWGILLAFYFLVLYKEKSAKWNRLYLWMSLALGIIIPFLENPFFSLQSVGSFPNAPAIWNNNMGITSPENSGTISVEPNETSIDWINVVFYIWAIGASVQLFILVKNTFHLFFLKKYSQIKLHKRAKYYSNTNTTSAFSFGADIFLPEEQYSDKDLDLILQHEHNHNLHKHWIDNVLLELLQIVLWANPIFYVFKKQIKLVHEYEVDADIDPEDQYEYGKLLLAQNNKTYKTVLVHTFNFSPLKNRIAMMTNNKKAKNWKFLLALPLAGLCFTLMSASPTSDERVRKNNITIYKGNKFEWDQPQEQQIVIVDPVSGEEIIQTMTGHEQIKKCNGITIENGINLIDYPNPTNYYASEDLRTIAWNISMAIMDRKKEFPKGLTYINLYNIVLDKDYKVKYFDAQFMGKDRSDTSVFAINQPISAMQTLDKILSNPKLVNPKSLKSDKPYYDIRTQAQLGTTTFRFEPVETK